MIEKPSAGCTARTARGHLRILPVLDLMGGVLVHAQGGLRQDYRPIVSVLSNDGTPLAMARAFRETLGLTELYAADLDAIAGDAPALAIWARLRDDGFRLWLDAGVSDLADAHIVARAGLGIVVGLETLAGPTMLAQIVAAFGEQVMLSLDLRDGKPIARYERWQRTEPTAITAEAIELGVQRVLVLDLARMGRSEGPATEELLDTMTKLYPEVEILAGGGIRDRADLLRLKNGGVSAVLVASALHDGRLTRADLEGL